MKITEKEVKNTAELARLEFSEQELDLFTDQLGSILGYINNLNELNTNDIEPTSHAIEVNIPLREDAVDQKITTEQVTMNAPQSEDDFFIVPKVIED